MMNEEALKKIGLVKSDFDEELKPEIDLISSVSTSGRLYRKAIQYIILKRLRIYFDNPSLNYSDDISQYFKYKGRKKAWAKFRDWMEFKIPELRVENFAIFLMVAYLLGYGYYVLKLLFGNTSFLAHVSLTSLSLSGMFMLGALAPIVVIFHLGKTELPAKSADGLVDKIIQENMHDLLTDDRKNLKEIIRKEIKVE